MVDKFTHNGVQFETRISNSGEETTVSVWVNGQRVGPTYTATNDVINDYKHDTGNNIVDELKATAQADIRRGLYTHKPTN